MRYAVFSDVHSNLEAFDAVLEVFKKSNIDKYVFVGDVVGYGADPGICIQKLKELSALCVAGNHDWACVGMTDIKNFNTEAKIGVIWTQAQLLDNERSFLSNLKLIAEYSSFLWVHGTLENPQNFDYMVDDQRASETFGLMKAQICFVGHSHKPAIFVQDGSNVSVNKNLCLKLEIGKRYIVNVGSVGQPRDLDARACFCIYDEEAKTIEFKRVSYDITLAQNKIIKAGLPKVLADRLSVGY